MITLRHFFTPGQKRGLKKNAKSLSARNKRRLEVELLERRELLNSDPIRLDFGTAVSPVAQGFTRVPLAVYNADPGYGWNDISQITAHSQSGNNDLTDDYHRGADGTFKVDLANGIYKVTATLGDATSALDNVFIAAEGQTVISDFTTNTGEILPVSFQVEVTDDQLDLYFSDGGGQTPNFSLAALDISKIDAPLTIDNVSDQVMLNTVDTFDLTLTSFAFTPTEDAKFLDNTLDLKKHWGGLYTNLYGNNEKWLQGAINLHGNRWYIITPDGTLTAWSGLRHQANGTQLANLDPIYYDFPHLLYEANVSRQVTYIAEAAGGEAWFLDQQLHLRYHGGLYYNAMGNNEKWLLGDVSAHGNRWYFLTPDGALTAWDGSSNATGTQIAILDPLYYHSPDLLYNAMPEHLAYVVDQRLRLYSFGSVYQNWGGHNEKWVPGRRNHFGNNWYFIKPDGSFWAWNGVAAADGDLLTTFDPIYWSNIDLLRHATPEQFSVSVTGNALTFDPVGGFVGTAVIEVSASDGMYAAKDRFTISVETEAPIANAGGDKTSNEGSAVSFSGSATGGEPGYTYSWDFGDGSTGSGQNLTHTYTDNGAYTVNLTVTDSFFQQSTDSLTVTVNNVAPTATHNGPYSESAGKAISFTGGATDPSSTDTAAGFTYLWTFGDGATSTQQSAGHAYAEAGTYTVTLKVTDKDGGNHTATTVATISEVGARYTEPFIITHHDKIPNFGANPTIYTVANGNWSNASTWSENRLPTAGDVVSIDNTFTVTYDMSSTDALKTVAIQNGGHLIFRTDIDTKLTVQNLLVLEGGELQVGTVANPVAADVKATIMFPDVPLDLENDPEQFGNGLIGLGKVTMYGAEQNETFVRLAVEPQAGDTTLTLEKPVTGWQVEDRLVIPDSKQWRRASGAYVPEWERVTIAAISADGKTLTLESPVQFDHPGARDPDGVLEFLPHVGNMTRNVSVRSEKALGTRGHTMFTGRADVDIRYAQFGGLGRTTTDPIDNTTFDEDGNVTHIGQNQIARYPVHFHHLIGPADTPANGYQYTFEGNSVFCPLASEHGFRWGITVHSSHYGLVKDNVLYNWSGAGIVTEAGNESYNVIEHNFVVAGNGVGDRLSLGNEGNAFWFRGSNNYIRNNVAANYVRSIPELAYGYKIFQRFLGNIRVPNSAGADTSVNGHYTLQNSNAMPMLEFSGNEVYGTENGLTIWWVGAFGSTPQDVAESVVKDYRAWHIAAKTFFGYPMTNVTFDGLVVRGDVNALVNPHERPLGLYFGDYMTKNLRVTNADIQGVRTGIYTPYFSRGEAIIENSYLRNAINIFINTPGAPATTPGGQFVPAKKTILRNVKFDALPGLALNNIVLNYTTWGGVANLVVSDEVFVYDYNQVAGDDFQVYYLEQSPEFIVPQSTDKLVGSPEEGLTNEENWATYGIAIAGSVTPTSETLEGITGFVSWI